MIATDADSLAVLREAREWLSDPKHWTTGEYRLPVDASWRGCKRTCGVGALIRAYNLRSESRHDRGALFAEARAHLADALGNEPVVVNDGRNGYARILAGYDKAISKLEAEAKT